MKVPIKGFEGMYEIDDGGNIYTIKRQGTDTRVMKTERKNDYNRVTLNKCGKKYRFLVHRLVAQHFVENPNNLPCINHKDGNKRNNAKENLEWCDYHENMVHAIKSNLNHVPALSGERHPRRKVDLDIVRKIRADACRGEKYVDIGKRYGITGEQVSNIVKMKHWKVAVPYHAESSNRIPAVFDDIEVEE